MAAMDDNRKDLYDVDGNHVGVGGPGMVTQPGADPSDGAHKQVVEAGVQKMEGDIAAAQNGVTDVAAPKASLSGWNYSGRVGSGSPLSGVVSAAKNTASIAAQQQPPKKIVETAPTPAVGSLTKSPALKELRENQNEAIMEEKANSAVMSDAEKAAEARDQEYIKKTEAREAKLKGANFVSQDGDEYTFDHMDGDNAVFKNENGDTQSLALNDFNIDQNKHVTIEATKPAAATDNGGQPKVDERQLKAEKDANPQSSNSGDGRADGSAQQTANNNDGRTEVADPKFTTGESAGMNAVSDEDYAAAKQRISEAKKGNKIPDQQDEETVWLHDNPRPVQPQMPALEEFTESQPPKLKDIDESYRNAYAIMEARVKAAGDDPESKAKRAKARRSQLLVAALGDLLQAAANMWGAAKGATSAKLSSLTAGVAKRHAVEDAAELKREAQRAKDLERMVRRGEKLTDSQNKQLMELWKAGENARKYNISEKNKAILAEYGKRNEAWGKDYASWLRRFEKIGKDNASARREANTFARQKTMEAIRQANREKNQATSHRNALARKQAPSYRDLHDDE